MEDDYSKSSIQESLTKIDQEEQELLEELKKIDIQIYEAKKAMPSRMHCFLKNAGRKALFIASLPFYWLVFFKYVIGSFNASFFAFVIVCSLVLSYFGGNWGILNSMIK